MSSTSIFNQINNVLNQENRTAGDLLQISNLGADRVLSFPPGLARDASQGKSGVESAIPYVLFMPFRSSGMNSFRSIDPTKVLDNLPPPSFAIALPLPSSALRTQYGVQYGEVELGFGAQILTGLSQYGDIVSTPGTMKSSVDKLAGLFSTQIGTAAYQGLIGAIEGLGGEGIANTVRKGSGITDNPFTEHIFKNVEFRTHEFSYSFIPRNEAESRLVDRIIQLFKFYMLPSNHVGAGISTTGATFFSFPYEFQIIYSVSDTTFTLLPSVLETMSVNYAEGVDSPKFMMPTAKGKQYPSKITLSLTFKESMLLTRDKIASDDVDVTTENSSATAQFTRYRF
jgi:hypothetical protein